uniref:Uncharacterized protein n=1 Tax=Ascaris lumbricoides TaxID=6252 RepID=A0A0M3IXA1_ASCLU
MEQDAEVRLSLDEIFEFCGGFWDEGGVCNGDEAFNAATILFFLVAARPRDSSLRGNQRCKSARRTYDGNT